jgi:hypothetical protein
LKAAFLLLAMTGLGVLEAVFFLAAMREERLNEKREGKQEKG